MRNKFSLRLSTALALVVAGLMMAGHSTAQETVLYSFTGASDGSEPYGTLILDSSGNLYGTTSGGGIGGGTVFELTPVSGGGWTPKTLHSFSTTGNDGTVPFAGVTFDSAGNLYGTTCYGGVYGSGTVYELKRTKSGLTEGVLHSFNTNGKDGTCPAARLTFDSAGNLYGTTATGGTYNGGTAFELVPKTAGSWSERVLVSFNSNGILASSSAPLLFDAAGNLYGTTVYGGTHGCGTAFELQHKGTAWAERVLHNFNCNVDGELPYSGVISDSSGNLYGTTFFAGANNGGTVFELSQGAGGGWSEKVLCNFSSLNGGAYDPLGGLTFDANGNLYGTTFYGGTYNYGVVFELTPAGAGNWTENVLYSFGNGSDGIQPLTGLVIDSQGNLYGTTGQGGIHDAGTVFEVTP